MAQNDIYTTALLQQHGTGLHTRADANGNHAMSSGLIDSYAQAGKTVPAHMQPMLRELNDLTQREVVMAKATPGARVALGGSGYNPMQVRDRMAAIEQQLFADSADVRNIGERLENERMQQQVTQLELANEFTSRTQEGRIEDQLATYSLNRQQSLNDLDVAEKTALVRQLSEQADTDGVTIEAMTDAWRSNDPALMKSIFGTANKDVAHAMLTNRMALNDTANANRIASMASEINLQSSEIATDDSISDADLQGMIAGDLPMPQGANKFTLAEAMEKRAVRVQAQVKLMEAETQGLVKGAEYEQTLLASLTPQELAVQFGMLFQKSGMAGPEQPNGVAREILRAVTEGRTADVAQATASALQQIGSDGFLEIQTSTGSTARISATRLMQAMIERTQNEAAGIGQKLLQNQRFQQFSAELAETDKQIASTQALFGRPLPQAAQTALRVQRGQAMRMMELAAAEPDATKQAEMTAAAGDLMQKARKDMGEAIRAYGGSPGLVEDIEAGRFASEANHKQALIGAIGFGAAGPRARSPLGEMLNKLVMSKDISPRDFETWAADKDKGLADLGITAAEVFGIIDNVNYQVLGATIMETIVSDKRFSDLLTDPATDKLEPWVESALGPLLDGSLGDERKLTPNETLSRVLDVARIVDQVAQQRDQEVQRQQGGPPSYKSGQLMQAVQDNLLNSNALTNFMTNGAGTPSREMAAYMSEILHFFEGDIPKAGEGSVAFEDMANEIAKLSLDRYANAAAGRQLNSLAGVRVRAKTDAQRALLAGGSMSGDYQNKLANLEIAVLGVYADKLADPDAFRSTAFGVPLWSTGMSDMSVIQVPGAGGGYTIADLDQIRAKLREQGQNPDEILGAQ